MAMMGKDVNMFLVHGKNGLFVSSCDPKKSGEAESEPEASSNSAPNADVINRFSSEQLWSMDRAARLYSRSPNNNVAIVDDRLGLSILNVNSECSSEPSFDTLRGVGKFRHLYTPIGCKNIKHLQWSNNGVYLVIYFNLNNYSKETLLSLDDNLHIWNISQKSVVGTFSTRRLSPEQWPIVKWVGKEDMFAICSAKEVSLYAIGSGEATTLKSTRLLISIPVPRVFSVEVCQGKDSSEADGNTAPGGLEKGGVVTAKGAGNKGEKKNALTALQNGSYVSLAAYSKADISTQLSGNLYITTIKAVGNQLVEVSPHNHELKTEDSAEMLWSPSGKYLLVHGQSTVDLAGQRYGSSSNCLLFRDDGTFIGCANAHNTHDARWSPVRDEFILMAGNMPCDITLYDASCRPLFVFPKSYRNTIRWNPLGNMVALCGFGNLAGEICFWYRKDTSDYEQIVHLKEPCTVVSDWSHDSRYFLTASTFPRMKVDNFLKIFNHEGDLIESQKFEECYDVCWMGSPGSGTEFVRPRVKKGVEPKAIYRPKIQTKEEDFKSVNDGAFRVPAGLGIPHQPLKGYSDMPPTPRLPANKMVSSDNIGDSSLRASPRSVRAPFKNKIPLNNSRIPRETHYRGSLFSNDHGDKNDPSVDLLDAFKHVFALSQASQPPVRPPYEPQHQPQMHPPTPPHQYGPDVMENPQMMPDRRMNYVGRPVPNNPAVSNPQESASKNLSMLMRIKNQLHCEKSKPLQQSILDEMQLLNLLIEAKNRSVNRPPVE